MDKAQRLLEKSEAACLITNSLSAECHLERLLIMMILIRAFPPPLRRGAPGSASCNDGVRIGEGETGDLCPMHRGDSP
jgi:hypothetical protein